MALYAILKAFGKEECDKIDELKYSFMGYINWFLWNKTKQELYAEKMRQKG